MIAIDSSAQPIQALQFEDDGATPNSRLPVLLYQLKLAPGDDNASAFETLFAAHQWIPLWRAGIFDYHHFHPMHMRCLALPAARLGSCWAAQRVRR